MSQALEVAFNKASEFSFFREHANMVRRRKQCLLEQIQSHHLQDWNHNQDHEKHCYDTEWPSHLPLFSSELDSRNPKLTGLVVPGVLNCHIKIYIVLQVH